MGAGYRVNTIQHLHEVAEGNNCTLFSASPTHLLLDFDPAPPPDFVHRLALVAEKFGSAVIVDEWRSRNGGLHMVVKIPLVLQPAERTALQAALGSDPKREIIAIWEQLNNPDEDTNTLFKPNGVEA